MKAILDLDSETTTHVAATLEKLQNCLIVEERAVQLDNDFFLHLLELLRTCQIKDIIGVEYTLVEMKRKNLTFTFEFFKKHYLAHVERQPRENSHLNFYFLLNHTSDLSIKLNEFTIRRLRQDERAAMEKKMVTYLGQNAWFKQKVDFGRNEIYSFQGSFNNWETAKSRFYSTFHLYKGMLEFAYHRNRWTHRLDQNIDNRKWFSCFKYPLFIYVTHSAGDYFNDYFEHEDYPYDYMEWQENVRNKEALQFFEHTFKMLSEGSLHKSMEELFSDCFRLYGRGIDTPYMDQSFLYFWNLLERISLSARGDTDTIMRRVQDFFHSDFAQDNKYSIAELKNIRNRRVHRGMGDIDLMDVNLLKYLCDFSLSFLLGNPPQPHAVLKTSKHLEAFYALKDHAWIKEMKEVVDFVSELKENRV